MNFLEAMTILLLYLAMCYGWGSMAQQWIARNEISHPVFLAVLGMAILVFLGGILNLAEFAYSPLLYGLLISGLVFCAVSLLTHLPQIQNTLSLSNSHTKLELWHRLPSLAVIFAVIVFFAITLVPSDVFNHGDDFQTYIPRSIRMLQIGTMGGDPYEMLGLDSLGAQAFMQGFILLQYPVGFLPGFDTVLCQALAALLLIAIGRLFNLGWLHITLATLVFIVINPQSVNVSALYSGVAMILAILFASCVLTRKLEDAQVKQPAGIAAFTGILLAALIELKTTLAFFAVIYISIFFLALLAISARKRRILVLAATTGIATVTAALPWLLLHASHYLDAFHMHSSTENTTRSGMFSQYQGNIGELFTSHNLYYGGTTIGYWILIITLATLCAFAIYLLKRDKDSILRSGYVLVAASASLATLITYFLNGSLFPAEVAIRYSCPVLIAVLPFVMLATSYNSSFAVSRHRGAHTAMRLSAFMATTLALIFFSSNFYSRMMLAYSQHTTVSFPINNDYVQFNRYTLSERAQSYIRNIQYQTEPGTKLWAWISMPLHLDYSRNQIQAMMEVGVSNPWLKLPFKGTPDDLLNYFREQGIRYILWEYHGGGMRDEDEYERMRHSSNPAYRKLAERNLDLRSLLFNLMSRGRLLVHKNGIVLFDLEQFGVNAQSNPL